MSMRRLFAILAILFAASCVQPTAKEHIKERPTFSTHIADPQLRVIIDEYFRLSARNHVAFNGRVSVGFSNIDRGRVIGTCTYRPTFREIDLDKRFWKESTWESKVALLYHELTHCYCERDHDFDDGEKYPNDSLEEIIQAIFAKQPFTPLKPDGYLEDSCPKSIMHPVIISDECFLTHYDYYTKEMFARCKAF